MTWLPIPGFEPYEVSDAGEIRRAGRILTKQMHRGYQRVQVWMQGRPKSLRVHRAVCLAFNGAQPSPAHEVEHVDHNKNNNTPANLRWVSHTDNVARSVADGKWPRGELVGCSVLTQEQVREIKRQPYYYGYARDLAKRFKVSPQTITAIRKGNAWRHVA